MSNISASYSGVLLVLSCVDVNSGTASVELIHAYIMCIRVTTYEIYQLSNIGILLLKHMSDKISICVHTDTIILQIVHINNCQWEMYLLPHFQNFCISWFSRCLYFQDSGNCGNTGLWKLWKYLILNDKHFKEEMYEFHVCLYLCVCKYVHIYV